jgi:ketosteroid isomerase-like protein
MRISIETIGVHARYSWTMSEETVETVRPHNEAWNRRDLTTWLGTFSSDAEIDWSRSRGPLKGVYRGPAELEVFWDAFWSTFKDVQVEMHRFMEVGSEVVVPNTAHVQGRQGIEVVARSTFVFTVENGKTTRLRLFQERAEALEAAGLSSWRPER